MGPLNADDEAARPSSGRATSSTRSRWTTLGEYLEYLTRQGRLAERRLVRRRDHGAQSTSSAKRTSIRRRRSWRGCGALVREAMQRGRPRRRLVADLRAGLLTPRRTSWSRWRTEAARCGGMYICHMRNEGDRLLEAIDELIEIAREAGAPAEIYHFKQAGRDELGQARRRRSRTSRRRARAGLRITADMYTYTAGATGLDAAMPPWVQEGGLEAWVERLKDPATRARVCAEMRTPDRRLGEPRCWSPASPTRCCWSASRTAKLKPLTGKTLAEVARAARQVARGDRRWTWSSRTTAASRHGLLPDERGQCPPRGRRCRG